ncbi:hypothetical protein Bbelb_446950, partial [Branchiostoma belcheri]
VELYFYEGNYQWFHLSSCHGSNPGLSSTVRGTACRSGSSTGQWWCGRTSRRSGTGSGWTGVYPAHLGITHSLITTDRTLPGIFSVLGVLPDRPGQVLRGGKND